MYSKSSRWHIASSCGYASHSRRLVWMAVFFTFTLLARPGKSAPIDDTREQFTTGRYVECLKSTQKAIEDGAYSVEWRILMIKS
ncbi:MAG: hypothetical protein ACYTEK_24665, partial [Planctomycetota bacterium]